MCFWDVLCSRNLSSANRDNHFFLSNAPVFVSFFSPLKVYSDAQVTVLDHRVGRRQPLLDLIPGECSQSFKMKI